MYHPSWFCRLQWNHHIAKRINFHSDQRNGIQSKFYRQVLYYSWCFIVKLKCSLDVNCERICKAIHGSNLMQVEKISRFLCKTNLMQWLQEQELIFLEHTFSVIKSNEETFVLNGQQRDDKPVLIDIGGTTLLYTLEGSGRNLVKKLRGQGPIKHSIQIYVRSCRFSHLIQWSWFS